MSVNFKDSHQNTETFTSMHQESFSLDAKIEIFQFYTDLLRKLELIKFTVSFNGLNMQKTLGEKYLIEIDNVRIKDEDDNMIYHTFSAKYGKDYYSEKFYRKKI